MRTASVFAGQTRTNQPSCAAAPAAGTPISSATIRVARKNGRIRAPALLSQIDNVGRKSDGRASILRIETATLPGKWQALIQIKVRRDSARSLIARNAGDEG